ARHLCLPVFGRAVPDQGVRTGLDDRRQRLCRPGPFALPGPTRGASGRGRVCRADLDHPVAWRGRPDRPIGPAGGGSIARVDAGGILHVGPESAGAVPGPACYGNGGGAATVTDANLVLGYLDPASFLGGRRSLDRRAAELAVDDVAAALRIDRLTAAQGIHRVVNTTMAEGVRLVSVRRGVDPRRFALFAFGGASGLHVTDIAR